MIACFPALAALLISTAQPQASSLVADLEPGVDQPEKQLIEVAKTEISAGSFEQAIAHLNEALERNPNDPALSALLVTAKGKGADGYCETGKKLLAARKYRDAGVAFDNALDLVPGHPLAKKGKEASKKWPTAESYCDTARMYLEKRDWDEAIAYYDKAFELTQDPSIAKWLAAARAARAKQHSQP